PPFEILIFLDPAIGLHDLERIARRHENQGKQVVRIQCNGCDERIELLGLEQLIGRLRSGRRLILRYRGVYGDYAKGPAKQSRDAKPLSRPAVYACFLQTTHSRRLCRLISIYKKYRTSWRAAVDTSQFGEKLFALFYRFNVEI